MCWCAVKHRHTHFVFMLLLTLNNSRPADDIAVAGKMWFLSVTEVQSYSAVSRTVAVIGASTNVVFYYETSVCLSDCEQDYAKGNNLIVARFSCKLVKYGVALGKNRLNFGMDPIHDGNCFYRRSICEGGLGSHNSVHPSVCHTRGLWQIWMVHCRYFDTTRKGNHSTTLTPTVVGGRRPLPSEICAQSDPPPSRNADFDRFPLIMSQLYKIAKKVQLRRI